MAQESTELQSAKPPAGHTSRPVSEGAEQWLGVPIRVLDHGFVYLVDYMGNDQAIEQAARVSYGAGTRRVSETRGLIRYLRRHGHTTPFEMAELKFHAKMPLFVARQWARHRTASINEQSGRYSILDNEFYLPEPEALASQSSLNRQGREEAVPGEYAQYVRQILIEDASGQYRHYKELLNDDGTGKRRDHQKPMLARELARMGLGLNFYTQWYWKVNLHNLMHFSSLRMDQHAQHEIRVYAEAIARIAKDSFPVAWEAFEDYQLNAMKFSQPELEVLKSLLGRRVSATPGQLIAQSEMLGLANKREQAELIDKMRILGIVKD